VDSALPVLREAVAQSVNHLDTPDFYGSHVTNQGIDRMKRPPPHSTWWPRLPHREHTRSKAQEEGPALDHVGIDVHKGASQICVIAEGGELIERRVRTEPARLAEALEIGYRRGF
jgi:hypothetical protein